MADAFRDAVLDLVIKEVLRAKKAKDDARQATAVSVLAEALGKAIGLVCDGDAKGMEVLLTGTEAVVAEIAVDTAQDIAAVKTLIHGATKK